MATDFDPYRILEVPPSASQEQIDEAYRRHWAASGSDAAPEVRLRELQVAYQLLGDLAERRSYDERRANAPAPAAAAVATRDIPFETSNQPAFDGPLGTEPWMLLDILKGIGTLLAIGLIVLVPFALIANAVADSRGVEDDPTALGIGYIGGAFIDVVFVGVAYWFSVRKYHLNWSRLGLRKPIRGWPWLPFVLVVASMTLVGVYGVVTNAFGWHPKTDLSDTTYDNAFPLIVVVILAVILAPIAEEVLFRGFIFAGLVGKWGLVPAALVGGAAFGFAHALNPGGLYIFLPISAIGVIFCWGYYYSRSIYTSMAAHFMFNLIQMIAVLATR